MNTFHLDILAAEGSFFSGACESLIVTTPEGQRGILAHRANIITALVPGELIFRTPDGVSHRAAVSSGLIKVEDNSVLVLVDSAERPEDIDANLAKQAEARAREELLQKRSQMEYRLAQANLARALNRLRISGEHKH